MSDQIGVLSPLEERNARLEEKVHFMALELAEAKTRAAEFKAQSLEARLEVAHLKSQLLISRSDLSMLKNSMDLLKLDVDVQALAQDELLFAESEEEKDENGVKKKYMATRKGRLLNPYSKSKEPSTPSRPRRVVVCPPAPKKA
jgi:hypothetical protein